MKNKKIKIIITAVLCAGIISTASFAVTAKSNEKTKNDLSGLMQAMENEFILDGKFPEDFELPEGAERHTFKHDGRQKGMSFGIGIGGIRAHFGSDGVCIADILGISEDELAAKLEEADGNIFKILEDSGKLDEYKAKLLDSFKAKLDEQVKSGAISQDKADEAYKMLEEAVNNFSSDGLGTPRGGHTREFKGYDESEKGGKGPGTTKNFEPKQTAGGNIEI